ncbi:hypothetical protein D3C74_134320 [compost metagenome]
MQHKNRSKLKKSLFGFFIVYCPMSVNYYLDDDDIELKGDTPYKNVVDPAKIGDLTVYGEFNGVTDRYKETGYGDIPVFEVKYYSLQNYNQY